MNKTIIDVPKGIRFLSDWKDFKLPETPTIINKQICGCGFTEFCINNSDDVILVSPRKILLENKAKQHKNDSRLLYIKNDLDPTLKVDDPDSTKKSQDSFSEEEIKEKIMYLHQKIKDHYLEVPRNSGCKYLVTYDSFRHIKEVLGDRINTFYVVVDEMQAIFTDASFKPTTGIELLHYLRGLNRLCFVSATPMIDTYLEMLDEFKNIDYIDLDWGKLDPSRVIRPQLGVFPCRSVIGELQRIISEYRSGNFEKCSSLNASGDIEEIYSTEAVFYVNSVNLICSTIKKCSLVPEEVNILCAKTDENEKKVRDAFKFVFKEKGQVFDKDLVQIGEVPTRGEPHKMFTFCTKTTYIGADFYSTCARTFIFSDSKIDSLSLDVSMDLPQIIGRQRNNMPWKNRAEIYYKPNSSSKEEDIKKQEQLIKDKLDNTDDLILSYNTSPTTKSKYTLAKAYLRTAERDRYKADYVSVDTHDGGMLVPCKNMLVAIADKRTLDISRIDFKDRFIVFSLFSKVSEEVTTITRVDELLREFDTFTNFVDRLRFICETVMTPLEKFQVLERVPIVFKNYYTVLGPEKCKALEYRLGAIKSEYNSILTKQSNSLVDKIKKEFVVGSRYTKKYIKETLRKIYEGEGLSDTPKAADLSRWFSIVDCRVSNGKDRESGFLIVKEL